MEIDGLMQIEVRGAGPAAMACHPRVPWVGREKQQCGAESACLGLCFSRGGVGRGQFKTNFSTFFNVINCDEKFFSRLILICVTGTQNQCSFINWSIQGLS